MKTKIVIVTFLAVAASFFIFRGQSLVEMIRPVTQVTKCPCGPAEHVFYKLCVKKYISLFPAQGLEEHKDYEGLSDNLINAIDLLVQSISFVDQDGQAIVPELSPKGYIYLPLMKNPDYVLLKKIISHVDLATTQSAQDLYTSWLQQLELMKSAQ